MAIAKVIKYEGDNNTFIWKHPSEDFNSLTQLVVHESQEAVFFLNGQALDLFGPGRHTLETQNIPMIGGALKRTTAGREDPFHCEVYFINKTVQMGVKWGTDSKVRFLEPTTGIPLELGASGEMNLQVTDSRKLLVKLVGTTKGIAWGDEPFGFTKSLKESFRPMISTAVKSNLADGIVESNIDVLEIDRHLETLSHTLHHRVEPGFAEYGLAVPQFYITNIVLPETDPNFKRLRELHTISLQTKVAEAEATVKTAQAEAAAQIETAKRKAELERQTTETEIARREAERELIRAQAEAQAAKLAGFAEAEVMRAKGYTEKDVLQAEVQKAYAEGIGNMGANGGGSGITGDFVGLGVGLAAAGAVSGQVGDLFKGLVPQNSENPQNATICPNCGQPVPETAKFCMECGYKFVSKCPKCGNDVAKGAKFCMECGEKL